MSAVMLYQRYLGEEIHLHLPGPGPFARGKSFLQMHRFNCQLPASSKKLRGRAALVQERSRHLIDAGALGDLRLPPRGESPLRQTKYSLFYNTPRYKRNDRIHGQLRCKVADLCLSVSWPLFGLKRALVVHSIYDMSPVGGTDASELCLESGTPPRGVTSVA